ncbi:MAG TPA: ABC transporter permease subunit [Rectinemataceae bacterium]|nr:ABC transporter permease subunit [Rectinemataceae bacterium]
MKASRLGDSRAAKIAALPLILLILAAGLLPFFTAIVNSLFHDRYGQATWAGLDNFRTLVDDRAFVLSLGITLGWALLSASLSVCLGFVLASVLLDAKKGFKMIYAAILVPWGVPSFISVPIWRMIIHGSGGKSILSAMLGREINLLTNPAAGFVAALAVDVWLSVPLVVFALYAALGSVNHSATEAASLDGADSWTIARWIRAPQARATLIVMWTLDFVRSFKEFQVPFLMTAGGPPFIGGITEKNIVGATTTLEIFLYDAFRNENDYGIPSAYAVAVGFLVVLLVALWFRLRKRTEGKELMTRPRIGGGAASLTWRAACWTARIFALASAALVIYAVLWLSLSDLSAVYIDRPLPRFLSLRPYLAVLRDEGILRYFFNTFLVAAATALLIPFFTLPAALALSRATARRQAKAFAFLQALGMTGGVHSLIPLFILFRLLGLLGGYVPLVTVYLFHALPFSLFTLKAFLDRLPPSYEEEAALEGMKPLAYLLKIVAPLSAPALAAAMMTAFISAWNGFLVPLVFITDDRLYTIGVKLHSYVGSVASGNPQWNLFAASSVINMIFVGLLLWRFKNPLKRNDATGDEG